MRSTTSTSTRPTTSSPTSSTSTTPSAPTESTSSRPTTHRSQGKEHPDDLKPEEQRERDRLQRERDQRELTNAGISAKVDSLLRRYYYDPSTVGSLGGADIFTRQVASKPSIKLKRRTIEMWLSSQEPYILHRRQIARRYKTNPIKVRRVGQIFQADIIFYRDIKQYGFQYLLLIQDTASRYLWFKFLKTKACKEVLGKIKLIFTEARNIPEFLFCDRGSEFICKEVQEYLKSVNCKMYHTGSSSHKTPHLDRATRYLNERMAIYFTHKETANWVKIVGRLVSSYNRMKNRNTNKTPLQIWKSKIVSDWKRDDREAMKKEKPKLKVGQRVALVGTELGPVGMIHSYRGRVSLETYEIIKVDTSQERPVYTLRDERGEVLIGRFYPEEVIRVRTPVTGQRDWKIEKVIRHRVNKDTGEREVYVKYKNRDSRYNEWIKESTVYDIPKVVIKRRNK